MARKVKNAKISRFHHSRLRSISRVSRFSDFRGNALAPFGVASIFSKKTSAPIRREPYVMDRLSVERPAKPLRNNWLDPFRSVCADRKERRSVLFAKNKVGKGKAIHTPKTFSIRSSVKCKG